MSSQGHVGQASSKRFERLWQGITRACTRFRTDEGASLIEYALMVSLIALVCLSALRFFQAKVTSKLDCSASQLNSSTGATC